MLADNLLQKIGFTDCQQQEYYKYRALTDNRLAECAEKFMMESISFDEALSSIHEMFGHLHSYTVDLLFVLECTGFLLEKYRAAGIAESIFINSMCDIKYKLDECLQVKHIFGIFVIDWYKGFLSLKRLALGRLQYDITEYDGDDIKLGHFLIKNGDFVLKCHIPSSGPLRPELCVESFKMAYDFFREHLKNGILPILCHSWLLYPPYQKVFGEHSNTHAFTEFFNIVQVEPKEAFHDAWRVFGMQLGDNTDILPAHTTLQKNFIKYIEEGNGFGIAIGVILFDGSNTIKIL